MFEILLCHILQMLLFCLLNPYLKKLNFLDPLIFTYLMNMSYNLLHTLHEYIMWQTSLSLLTFVVITRWSDARVHHLRWRKNIEKWVLWGAEVSVIFIFGWPWIMHSGLAERCCGHCQITLTARLIFKRLEFRAKCFQQH